MEQRQMNILKNKKHYILLFFLQMPLLILLIFACDSNDPVEPFFNPNAPVIDSVKPDVVSIGGALYIYGKNFGDTLDGSYASIGGNFERYLLWNDSAIVAYVPDCAKLRAQIWVWSGNCKSNCLDYDLSTECDVLGTIFNDTCRNVDLSSLNLRALPECIGNLYYARSLNLNDNDLSELHGNICNLAQLNILSASFNNLSALPDNFGRLTGLYKVNLASNLLAKLPESFCKLYNLSNLNLKHNKLSALPVNFGKLSELIDLNLAKNLFASVPEPIFDLNILSELVLSNNMIMALPSDCSGRLPKLQYLYLDGNQLAELPEELAWLKGLIKFDLSGNQLSSLPSSFGLLEKLAWLDLSDNNLVKLPESMKNLKNLGWLFLSGNNFSDSDKDIIQGWLPKCNIRW
jgi:Leucine-rich repeat (LRR) protein